MGRGGFANTLAFSTGGVERVTINSSGLVMPSSQQVLVDFGTVGAPGLAFNSDADTGLFRSGVNQIAHATNGVERMRMFADGDVRIGDGSAIATTAVAGFLLIPGTAGTPTGDPTNDGVGAVALVYDTTNNLLYANDGGGWVAVNSP